MIRRVLLALVLAGSLSAIVGAQGTAAAPDPHARCVGEFVAAAAGPGFGTTIVAPFAQTGELGHVVGTEASTDTCAD